MKLFTRGMLGALVITAGIGIDKQGWSLPPGWNPLSALDVSAPITPVTHWKLSRLKGDPEACMAALATTPPETLSYTPLEDHTPVAGCPLNNVVRIQHGQAAFNHSFVASCPLALSWALYERHRLQPLARELFDQPVAEVQHYGSFACRNVNGAKEGRRSDHAKAAALDVAAFRLADGRRISVLKDWSDEGEVGTFLQRAQDEACGLFGTVLGPDYNAAHANHLHLGMRRISFCR